MPRRISLEGWAGRTCVLACAVALSATAVAADIVVAPAGNDERAPDHAQSTDTAPIADRPTAVPDESVALLLASASRPERLSPRPTDRKCRANFAALKCSTRFEGRAFDASAAMRSLGAAPAAWNLASNVSGDNNHVIFGSRATYGLTERLDLGVLASVLMNGQGRTLERKLGVEIDAAIVNDVHASFGFQAAGRDIGDLAPQAVSLRLRYLLDADLSGLARLLARPAL